MPNSTDLSPEQQTLTLQEALNLGLQHHTEGDITKAESIYQQILQTHPNQPDALHLLGVVSHQGGKKDIALDLIKKAIDLRPDFAEAHSNMGNVLRELGRLDEAVASYHKALAIKPDYAEAHCNLGLALQELRRLDESIDSYHKALTIEPDYAEAHYNLGITLQERGKLDEAVSSYHRAIDNKPGFAEAYNNLGLVLKSLGKPEEAVTSYQNALSIKPDYAKAHSNLGNALQELGRLKEGLPHYHKALEINPDYAEAHSNLGNTLKKLGQLDEAIASYRTAISIKPDLVEAYINLGNTQVELGLLDEAVANYHKAIDIKPDVAEAHSNLGRAFKELGKLDEAIASYHKSCAIKPDYSEAHSNLLFCLHYHPDMDAPRLKQEHLHWWETHGKCLPTLKPYDDLDLSLDRPLRVGMISPDFGHHPVGYLTIKLLENSNHQDVQFFCYCDRIISDNYTKRFAKAANQWAKTYGLSDLDLANKIKEDGIDILFDLAGHTPQNRLTMFARKPAPIQISWLGYMGTTGLATMDYILADRFQIPRGEERYYTETVLRMPHSSWCYDMPADILPVGPLPSKTNGYVTFGCFNNPAKINSRTLESWCHILGLIPNSKIVLKYRSMNSGYNKERINAAFQNHDIDKSRIILEGKSSYKEYLARYNAIDIALDTSPFSGGVTTCEALWMGVPVVTFPGQTFAGRLTLSHLKVIGLENTIADTFFGYSDIAVSLSRDLDALGRIRAGLRDQMESSPLCDGQGFAGAFYDLIRKVWASYVEKAVGTST